MYDKIHYKLKKKKKEKKEWKALGGVLENPDFGFSCALWLTEMVT